MINIYPSKLDGAPLETYQLDIADTIHGWLKKNVSNYEPRDVPPISVFINGVMADHSEWEFTYIRTSDVVDIYPEAKWEWVVAAIVAVISIAMSVYSLMSTGNMPKTGSPTKGDSLDEATAKGNKVKLNDIIREIAGTFKIYPDYLLPSHTYFVNETEQWIELLLCVGKGSYSIPDVTVLIGDTRFNALADNAQYTIYEPGANLAADTAAMWWHSATEVGGTSTGKTGLELGAYTDGEVAVATVYHFNGNAVTIPTGAGGWPSAWESGDDIRISQFLDYAVIEGWSDRDIISGNLSTLAPFVGMVIEIAGDNAGNYVIHSFETDSDGIDYITLNHDSGAQVNGLLTGTRRMSIAYRGRKYAITGFTTDSNGHVMVVNRYTSSGIIDTGWAGFGFAITIDAVIALDTSDYEGEWSGPFAACPLGETTGTIEYDLMCPNGLAKVEGSGALTPIKIKTELQWREISGSGVWNSVVLELEKSTLDQLGFTNSVTISPACRPEVKMRRIGTKSTSTSVQDTVQWYGLKARLTAPTSYTGVTTMTAKVRGGDRISAQSDQMISVFATRKLPTLVGGAWTAAMETRSIVPWVAYIAKSMGYTDADLSLADFATLGALWDSRGDYFDMAVESEGTVKGEMLNALTAGFAEFTLDRGVIKPVRDQIRTTYQHMYTPQNMTEQMTRSFKTLQPDEHDGVDVEYVDGESWAKETVECRLPGDLGGKAEKITVEGVTDRTRAWRIGMRQRRAQKYRRKSYKFTTELDALNSSYMSYCAIGDDVPGYSQSAILTAYTPVTGAVLLQSSEPFIWVDGVVHVIGIRRPDGTLSGPYSATRISEKVLSIPSIDFVPDTSWYIEPPHLIFGTVTRWSYPVLISSISHNGESKVDVEAVNYDSRIYDDDNNAP